MAGAIGEEIPSAEAAGSHNCSFSPCILTMRTSSPLFSVADSVSTTLGIDELYVDLSDESGLKSALDQEKWSAFIKNLLTYADADSLKCAVMGAFRRDLQQAM